jgi:hypothetical protein
VTAWDGSAERTLAAGQAALYGATGVWPLVHMASFEAVTGPKRERWLVRTVGILVAGIGATLALAAWRRSFGPEIRLLGGASAAGLAAVDLWYAGVRRRISPVYLADAAAEIALGVAWAVFARRAARREGER